MKTITYTTTIEQQTNIHIGKDMLSSVEKILSNAAYTSFVVLADTTTHKLYGATVIEQLKKIAPVMFILLPPGERSKTPSQLIHVWKMMIENTVDKKGCLIALGGGVVGDIATLAAATYYRGIDCIQIPTTLLAAVDAAIGGKGAIDIDEYKNIVGAISQPKEIIIDTSLFSSLPKEQIQSGWGEILKYGIAMNKSLFKILEKGSDKELPTEAIIANCIKLKTDRIQKDPTDTKGQRAILNFGHTLAHAIELEGNISHGKAVAIGMVFATKLSVKMQLLSQLDAARIIELIKAYNLPTSIQGLNTETIVNLMSHDKKAQDKTPRFVLLSGIGSAVSGITIEKKMLQETLEEMSI